MNTPLTQRESDFTAEHHNLVYSFLKDKHYAVGEYYDIAVFGYLHAVRKYLSREDIQENYEFSTVAYSDMRTAMYNHFRAEKSQKRYVETRSFDDDQDVPVYYDSVWETVSSRCEAQTAREKLPQVITQRQSKVVYMKANGYSNNEIGRECGISASNISRDIRAARVRIINNAPELMELIAA